MSRHSRSTRLLQNAEAALLAAIEIYNKPTFSYREETFAILALNAWELLVKAALLNVSGNHPRCLYVYYAPKTKTGAPSKKLRVRRNRSKNIMTIGLTEAFNRLEKQGTSIPTEVKRNIEALTEIRDNAVHYLNASPRLAHQVLEIGTASIKNFIELGKLWLDLDLSSSGLFLMPLGFLPPSTATALSLSKDEKKVIEYLATIAADQNPDPGHSYHVALGVDVSFKRTSATSAVPFVYSASADAVPVELSEEDIRKRWPWEYDELTDRLKARFSDFKVNDKYHKIRRSFAGDPKFMNTRYLDPGNLKSSKKDFYSPHVLTTFDSEYTLK
jgi:hypothetical protein